jgi:hypothetical protein
MGLTDRAKRDIERITSDLNGWASVLVFTAPTGEVATINGRFTKITLPNDEFDANTVNTLQAHVSFSEKFLTDLSYPIRTDGKVHLKNHTVLAIDSTGTAETYIIREWNPDETVGLIVCMVGYFTETE